MSRDSSLVKRESNTELSLLIDKIKRDKGLDLSGYKESTLTRRIERRMQFDGAGSLEEYIHMIDRDYHLYWRLVSDFFIGVTDFFRDSEIWEVVCEKVLPEIIDRKPKAIAGPLRIWSAGCSTGEETYSLAIAVMEVIKKENIRDLPVFIYGTDIMEDKLEIARIGEYDAEKVEKVEERLREKYFQPSAVSYQPSAKDFQLKAEVRQATRFRKYDLVQGEELRGFDIIVCRNVLIYFQRQLQERVLRNFHRALREGGILWLGSAESLSGEAAKLFEPIYKNEKIFKKI